MRARRQYFTEMKIKEWGLIECNDPTFYFMTTPQLLEDEDKEWILARNFSEELSGSLSECKRLVDSFVTTPEVEDYCEKREYRSIEEKLYVHLAFHIKDAEVLTDADEYPDWKPLDNDQPFDYDYDPKSP